MAAAAPAPIPLDDEARAWIDETMAALTLRERVGQLVIPWIPGGYASVTSPDFLEIAEDVRDRGVGGVSISIGLPHSYAAKLNELQALSKVPLLVTADFESGGPGMRINHSYALPTLLPQGGGTSFPPTMAFGAIGDDRFAYEYGRVTAIEARAVGVHFNFAPVLDVNSNPENPVINTRSFGEDPLAVGELGAAYIRGARAGGVQTTAKHFPGHGDTRIDSHLELPEIPADRSRLDALELVPFRRALVEGVDAVMTAHVSVPGVLGPDAPPATLSPYFLTELLRDELGFEGLLFTDALRMGAITNRYGGGEASVMALEAGADVLLAPADVGETIEAVVAAVESGRITAVRLDESVRRVLEAKARAGLHRDRFVDLDAIDEVVGSGAHLALADSAASRSITLPRDQAGLVPTDLTTTRSVLSVTYAGRRELMAGRAFDDWLAPYFDRLRRVRIDEETSTAVYDSVAGLSRTADLVLVSAYVPPRSGSGSVAVPEELVAFVEKVRSERPVVLASFGSPYLLSAFPGVGTYLVAWGDREVSQEAAARAVVGESAITGMLPISLPPYHGIGDGLARDSVPGAAAYGAARRNEDPLAEIMPPARRRPAGAQGGPPLLERTSPGGLTRVPVGALQGSPLEVDPASVGMSEAGLARLDSVLVTALADSAAPGAALAVGRHGRLVRLRGYGRLDWDEGSAPVTPSSIYDLASLTKVVGTTTAAAILWQEGVLELDAPVIRYLPWWAGGHADKRGVTVRQLLIHRGGLPPFRRFFLEMEGREAYQRAIADLELEYAPGDSTVYSDIGLMTVAFIVEELTGRSLDSFLQERVWRPLGMGDTSFAPTKELLPRIAPTEVDTSYRHTHVHGVVHDENAYALGGVAGHAGLFSSARDLAVFAAMMLNGGAAPPCGGAGLTGVPCSGRRPAEVRILRPETVAYITARHDESSSRALGWDTPSGQSSAGDYFGPDAFGHTGFTGTSIWMDPDLDLFVVLLTNRVNPTRDNQRHVPLRRAVHDAAARAIVDRPISPRQR